MKIQQTITVEHEVSPQQLAEVFWEMDQHQQIQFFAHLAYIADSLDFQMAAVSRDMPQGSRAREAMRIIGEYAE